MKQIWVVTKKEILDNLRDKRSFFFALVYGPVLLPLLIAGSLIAGVKGGIIDFESDTEVAVFGAHRAPNLIQFLHQNNIVEVEAPEDFKDKIKQGELNLVLEIPDDYVENFVAGKPAPLITYYSESSKDSSKAKRQLKTILEQYKQQLLYKRMYVRGFEMNFLEPIQIIERDLSAEGMSGQFLGTLLPFIMILSMIMGGMYLAVDSTAGERERHSLEPLLTLPLPRAAIILGKYIAIFLFVFLSGLLATINLYVVFSVMPIEELLAVFHFDGITFVKAFLLAAPVSLLITSMLALVSTYAKSTKEAQTHLGIATIIPMIPFFLMQFMKIKTSVLLMLVPLLSQYKLLEKIVKDESFPAIYALASIGGTLIVALALLALTIWFYQRERILD